MVGKIILRFQIVSIDFLYHLVQLLFGMRFGFWKQEYFIDAAWENIEILFKEICNLVHQIFTGH